MIQQPDAPRQFDICTGRDVGDFDLQTHSSIPKYIFPCEDIAGFARLAASRRGAFIGAVDIYVRAFLARRRRDAEAIVGLRASDAISSGKTTQSKRSCERRGYAEIAMRRRQDDL